MWNYPFDPNTWRGKPYMKEYRLWGIDMYQPTVSERGAHQYANYSKKYWEGVADRAYQYRMLKKIENDEWKKHL